jgi:hypothetical protein
MQEIERPRISYQAPQLQYGSGVLRGRDLPLNPQGHETYLVAPPGDELLKRSIYIMGRVCHGQAMSL